MFEIQKFESTDVWKLRNLRPRKVVLIKGTNSSCGMKSLWKLVWRSFSCSAVWKQLLKEKRKRCYHHVVWQERSFVGEGNFLNSIQNCLAWGFISRWKLLSSDSTQMPTSSRSVYGCCSKAFQPRLWIKLLKI